jgi:TolB protein
MAVDVKSGETVAVTDDRPRDLDPAWDPAADAVYFSSDRTGVLNVWRVSVDERGAPTDRPVQVTTGGEPETQIAFTRDGGRMAFSSTDRNSDLFGLDVFPATGEVTSQPYPIEVTRYEESRGDWASDGKVIAFNSDRGGHMNLWIKSIVTSGTRQVTFGPGGDYQPEWHNDMHQLLFYSSRSGNPDIWNVDIQSGLFAQFTDEPSIECNPVYSPNTRYIAYESDVSGRMELWVMRDDGSRKAQLSTTGVSGHFLLWMNDNDRVVFESPGPDGPQLHVVSASTGEVTPFTDVAGSGDMTRSPDGSLILGLVDHRSLWVTPAAGGAPEQVFELDEGGFLMDYPRWSPFGKRVMFDRYRPGGGDIRVVDGL